MVVEQPVVAEEPVVAETPTGVPRAGESAAADNVFIEPVLSETAAAEQILMQEPVVVASGASTVIIEEREHFALEGVTVSLERVAISEPATFSIAGQALKLDTAEDVAELCKQIGELKNLQTVRLAGNTLGIEASRALATALDAHATLRDVDLSDCFTGRMKEEVPVSVAAFGAVLVTKTQLEQVNFSDNAFGPIGAKALVELLSGSACLQDLVLNNNGLGPEGGRIIAEALVASAKVRASSEHGRPLRSVLIGRNRLENGSSEAFAKMLEVHAGIREFGLPQCGIRSEGIAALSKGLAACEDICVLDLQDNTFCTAASKAFAEALPRWAQLKSLNLGDCMCEAEGSVAIVEAMLQNASLLATLEFFNFQYNEMDERGARLLAGSVQKFKALRTLMLNGNAFDPEGETAAKLRASVAAGVLDELDDMEYDLEDQSENDDSGFISEADRMKLAQETEAADKDEA